MQLKTMTVTPEMAELWLNKNGKNRRLSIAHAQRIADSIKSGRWVLNGETICFDDNGNLLDGQHRLKAITLAGMSIDVAVAVGVSDPSAFETYDSVQRIRGASQIAEMKGVKNSNRVSASARIILSWEMSGDCDEFYRSIISGRGVGSPQEVSDKAVEIQDEHGEAWNMIGLTMARMSKAPAHITAIAMILNRIDPVTTASFFNRVKTGVVESENDPALIFRDRIISGRAKSVTERKWKAAVMAFAIKAWNAEKTGKPISTLWFRQESDSPEKFPRPIGGGK